jgi:hypothetical protein
MCGAPKSQTITQKTELDPNLQRLLYGGIFRVRLQHSLQRLQHRCRTATVVVVVVATIATATTRFPAALGLLRRVN